MRACNTASLKAINKTARDHGYERFLSRGTLRDVDPDGIHVLEVLVLDERDMAYRCRAMIKVKGVQAPFVEILDVHPGQYNELPEWKGPDAGWVGPGE